ncbi:MAG: metallophosphoesterase [Bacteroidetes bacterium]|nr:metallophosphoesterase [Bacteroidota bacterium]
MRPIQMIVFLTVVLSIYSAVNYYIYSRGLMAIPADSSFRPWYPWLYLFLSGSYIIARFLERMWLSPVSDVFTWIGSFWLGLMIYLLLAVIAIDIIRLIHLVLPVYPRIFGSAPSTARFWLFKGAIILAGLVVFAGYINAMNPVIRNLDLKIRKKSERHKELKIVLASDIHMGTLVGPSRTARLVKQINSLKPDLILFAGDMVDEDLAPVIRHDLGRSLKKLQAPLGVYAITGNHEYIGGAEKAVKYLQEHGITFLRDTSILVDNSFYLAGRDDKDKSRFSGKQRKSLSEVLEGVDKTRPIIMMDHQPFKLDEVQAAGVDLQLSGHTHHGQLWPFNYITSAIYELSWGYKQKGNSQFYVSSGYGGWGPPVRLGNRPELVCIKITFE